MKARSIFVLLVMFAVMAVPAFAVTLDDARQYLSYNSTLDDISGNALDGTASGSAQVTGSIYHVGNGSLDCGNTDSDLVTLPTSTIAGDSVGSISLWIYPDVAGNEQMFWSAATSGSATNRMRLMYDTSNKIQLNFNDGAWDSMTSDDTISPLAWHHIVVTHDGTNSRMYINGSLQSATSGNTWFDDISINRYRHCQRAYSPNKAFNGYLDEVAYYERALNQSEVDALYNSGTGFNPYVSTTPADTSFNITAYDAETAEQILTFNTTLNGTVLSTTNGTITYNVTGFYNTVVNASGYQTVTTSKTYVAGTTTQWNLTKINRTVTFKAFDNTSTPINTFNMTTGTGATYTTTNGTILASLDRTVLHNLTFKANNFFDNVTLNYNVTSDLNVTMLSPFRDVTFTATNYSGSPITDFNLTVNGTTYAVNTSQVVNLDTRELYNVTFDKYNYFGDVQTNVNVSSDVVGNLTEYFNILVGTESTSGGGTGTVVNGVDYSEVAFSALVDFTNSSTALSDPSGSGFELSLTGASIDTTSGYLLCDGTNDYAESNIPVNFTAPYTISFKLNQHVAKTDTPMVSKYIDNTDRLHIFSSNTLWEARYIATNSTANVDIKVPPSPYLAVNTDYVYTVVNDGSRTAVYLNGTLQANSSGNADVSNNALLRFCNSDVQKPANYWDGNFSQFYVFDTALTLSEVANHTQNVQNNNTFNPFTGGGAPVVVSNSTNQYYVNWNSTNYYPQTADNKTYLPVRFTLENFTVNPTTIEFKQAVFTNYNTTSHLAFTFNNSHQVTATNRYDSTAISNFTVNVSGTTYTANGTIAYLQNETGIVNYSVTHPSYFTAYGTNVSVTNGSSSVLMHQVEVRFNGSQRFTNNSVTEGNVTLPDSGGGLITKAFGEPFYLNAGTYLATYTSVHDEAKPINFTYTTLQNVTSTITNITNANLTITGTNAIDGSNIPFFTTTVVNDTLYINMSTTDNGPHLYNLIQNVTYNVVFDNTSYALNSTNITLTNRSTSIEFLVYTTNSFNISILNELTKDEITDTNFTIEFIGSYASYNYTYEDGNLYADLIVPDQYQIRYQWINTTGATDYGQLRQYHYILSNRTFNPLDLFALNKSESTEIEITVQNGNTLVREEGVIVKLQRFYIDTNSYETVAMYETDSQGKAHFDVEADNELYKFVIDSPLGTTVYTSTPQYIKETEYTIFIDTSEDPIASYTNNAGLTVTFTVTNTTATATYNDPHATADEYEFTVFERGPYTHTQVSTATATSSSGALVNTYAFEEGKSYYGVLYRDSVAEATADFVDFKETNGLPALGLFLTSILFVVAVFISAFSLYSVIIASIALVASNMIGLITISTPVIGAVVVGAIILAIILEWRRG